jgi:hypothetical protein
MRYGGRQKGTPNKTTQEIRELAREEGPACVQHLAAARDNPEVPWAVRTECAKELLNRGYGRPTQPIELDVAVSYEEMSFDQLAKRAARLAQTIRELAEGEARQLPSGTLDAELVEPEPVGSAAVGPEPKGDALGR